ncbi:MAG: 30S ribosomal protein S6 [Alphaproteobacteria bacterium]|nr:30S ribosomal protein S6 [Alphaproteobacteria bacterium]
MLTHEYETVVILRPDLDDADTKDNIDKLQEIIVENEGTMLLRDEWGKRKLAYPIANHLKGHYVLFNYLGPAPAIEEIERRIRINDRIIRFMTVVLEKNVDIPTKLANAEELRARRAEEARIKAEQEAERAANEDDLDDNDNDDDDDNDKEE